MCIYIYIYVYIYIYICICIYIYIYIYTPVIATPMHSQEVHGRSFNSIQVTFDPFPVYWIVRTESGPRGRTRVVIIPRTSRL